MHLRAEKVPIVRFPPISYLAMCVESPQCLHLFKGTNLRKRQWTYSAKYFPELVEVVRTNADKLHRQKWKDAGWHWARAPLYSVAPEDERVCHPWHMHNL